MANNKRKVTLLDVLKIMFKRVRVRTLIFLVITSAATSFAWFVYSTKVTAGLTAHIESWNILFTDSETELSEYVNFVIPNLYPGMTDYTDEISIVNLGERSAAITYEITDVRLLSQEFEIDGTYLTSNQMINKLALDYPFHITFSLANSTIDSNHGQTTFSFTTTWPYESGNDAADTTWGKNSYDYSQANPGTPSVSITLRITAAQSN